VRRVLAVALLLALVVSGAALAARGDPQKQINAADQARAKAMLIRKSDLPVGFKSSPSTQDDPDDSYCAPLDESDLTLTGEAYSPDFEARNIFQSGVVGVSSYGQVYESVADANASWRRGTSQAGLKCLRDELRKDADRGDRIISVGIVPYPRLAQRTAAYRVVVETQGIRLQLDFVGFMQSRGHGGVAVISFTPRQAKGELDRLARIVAARMKTAMRGA
jgi:hypothetical protein